MNVISTSYRPVNIINQASPTKDKAHSAMPSLTKFSSRDNISDRAVNRVALTLHEFGHLLIAKVVGFRVIGVKVSKTDGHVRTYTPPIETKMDYLKHLLLGVAANVAQEELPLKFEITNPETLSRLSFNKIDAAEDINQIRELLREMTKKNMIHGLNLSDLNPIELNNEIDVSEFRRLIKECDKTLNIPLIQALQVIANLVFENMPTEPAKNMALSLALKPNWDEEMVHEAFNTHFPKYDDSDWDRFKSAAEELLNNVDETIEQINSILNT